MKKSLIGMVTSDKRDKTVKVEVERRYRHPFYGKIVRGRTVCQVHDEENSAKWVTKLRLLNLDHCLKLNGGRLVKIVEASPVEE